MSDIKAFLFDDDRGVSPVIGVILMVAITVILAAVIAAFVLGLGDTNSSAPNVNWEYDLDESNNSLTIEHTSGETINPDRLSYSGDGLAGDPTPFSSPDSITAGTTDTVDVSGGSSGDEINIVFESEDGGTSSIIGTFTLPPDVDLS